MNLQSIEQWGSAYSRIVSSACDYSMTRGFLRLICLHLGPFGSKVAEVGHNRSTPDLHPLGAIVSNSLLYLYTVTWPAALGGLLLPMPLGDIPFRNQFLVPCSRPC